MPLELYCGEHAILGRLTWFQCFPNPERVAVKLDVIEREIVYFQLRPENLRILGQPVIDFFLLYLSILARDGQNKSFREGSDMLNLVRLLVVNHASAQRFEDTFSFRTLSAHFAPSQHMDLINVLKDAHLKRKRLLSQMTHWLYEHTLPSFDLLDLTTGYYDWRVNSKITLKMI